ncbi:hypothetical protein V6N11_035368 [Hibiscus sabdariffa]|uniref:Uncharacterized protein n=1 Tax=Hibiscus sabdariffa TaxID=183260 RepID=A0ABR2R064_9ROSI
MEELEARTLNYPTILTDPLLMGILIEDGSHFSRALDWAVNQKLKPVCTKQHKVVIWMHPGVFVIPYMI